MSTKEARNEARLINIAMAYISGSPDKRDRLKVERGLVKEALEFTEERIRQALDAIFQQESKEEKEARKNDRAYQAKLKAAQAEGEARAAASMAEYRKFVAQEQRKRETARVYNRERAALAKVGKAVVSMFETVKVGGQAVGEIWYSQLEGLRNKGAFEAALCQAILRHGKPAKDMRVRDLINEDALAKFVADAKRAVDRVKAAA